MVAIPPTTVPTVQWWEELRHLGEEFFLSNTPKVRLWRQALQARPSIQDAVVADYPERLLGFLKRRNAHLATLI